MNMKKELNIWTGMDFSIPVKKSPYNYLLEQRSNLIALTSGVLTMDVEVSSLDGKIIYKLYVVSKKLGNYRRIILSVSVVNTYPVDISYFDIDGSSVVVKGVLEDEFLDKISEVIQMPSVKILIESLYHQSTSNFYPS